MQWVEMHDEAMGRKRMQWAWADVRDRSLKLWWSHKDPWHRLALAQKQRPIPTSLLVINVEFVCNTYAYCWQLLYRYV